MKIRCILLLILLYVLNVSTIPNRHRRISIEKKLPKGHYCGENLATTLNQVCYGIYYQKTKRRGGEFRKNDFNELLGSHIEADDDDYKYPFIPRELAESLIPLKVRRDEEEGVIFTITEECCIEECTHEEMQTYCG